MSRVFLQEIIEDLPFDNMPANWAAFDLSSFSAGKQLWDYQQRAVKNALKTLLKYYEDYEDYLPREKPEEALRIDIIIRSFFRTLFIAEA